MMEGEPLALPGLWVGIGVGEAAVHVSECVCVCSHAGDGGVEAGLSDTPEQWEANKSGQGLAERNTHAPVSIWLRTPRTKTTLCWGQAPVDERPCFVQQNPGTLCRVGVQGREKIGSHRGQRPGGHTDLGTGEGEEITQRQRDPEESQRGEDMKEREREKAERTEPGWSWSEPRGRSQQDFERRKNGMETWGRVGPRGCSLQDIMSLSTSPASQPLAPHTGCPVWGWSMGSRP